MENVTLDMVYAEVKKVNQRVAALEHLLIPEEKLNSEELKELDEAVADAKKGNVTSFNKLRK
ncbi:MAG: hypothetical protein Q7S22_00850 [Candidatus Micrarchaeota archaeon]|nr:hypothetical protein [Candidatus Micrarchaeota archaeon]